MSAAQKGKTRLLDFEEQEGKQQQYTTQMADLENEMDIDIGKTTHKSILEGILGIQRTLNTLVQKLDSQTDQIESIKTDLYSREGIEDRLQMVITETHDQTSLISELQSENKQLTKELDTMKSYVIHVESRLDTQQAQISSLVERSMRENAIVTGVPEKREENVDLKQIFKNTLKINENIKIDRAHRIGPHTTNDHPRPIVVKFHDYNDREHVLKTTHKLAKNDATNHS